MASAPRPGPPWRILIVDDSRNDAELTLFALRDEGGLEVSTRRVDSADGLQRELAAFDPHLVLSDLNLPGFSGEEALALVRAQRPGVPVILLTGGWLPGQAPPQADGLVLKEEPQRMAALVREMLEGRRSGD